MCHEFPRRLQRMSRGITYRVWHSDDCEVSRFNFMRQCSLPSPRPTRRRHPRRMKTEGGGTGVTGRTDARTGLEKSARPIRFRRTYSSPLSFSSGGNVAVDPSLFPPSSLTQLRPRCVKSDLRSDKMGRVDTPKNVCSTFVRLLYIRIKIYLYCCKIDSAWFGLWTTGLSQKVLARLCELATMLGASSQKLTDTFWTTLYMWTKVLMWDCVMVS